MMRSLWYWQRGWEISFVLGSLVFVIVTMLVATHPLLTFVPQSPVEDPLNVPSITSMEPLLTTESIHYTSVPQKMLYAPALLFLIVVVIYGFQQTHIVSKSSGIIRGMMGSLSTHTAHHALRLLVFITLVFLWFRLILVFNDTIALYDNVNIQKNNFSLMMMGFDRSVPLVSFSYWWWGVIAGIFFPVLLLGIAKHSRKITISSWSYVDPSNPLDEEHVYTGWQKWWLVFIILGLSVWFFSPAFLGTNSVNYQLLWHWTGSISVWICLSICILVFCYVWRWRESSINLQVLSVSIAMICGVSITTFFFDQVQWSCASIIGSIAHASVFVMCIVSAVALSHQRTRGQWNNSVEQSQDPLVPVTRNARKIHR